MTQHHTNDHLDDAMFDALACALDDPAHAGSWTPQLEQARLHAASCPACSHKLGAHRELRMKLRRHASSTAVNCPDFLADQILQAARSTHSAHAAPARRSPTVIATTVLAAACLVGVAAAGVAIFSGAPAPSEFDVNNVAQHAVAQTPSTTPAPTKTIVVGSATSAQDKGRANYQEKPVRLGVAPSVPSDKAPIPAAAQPEDVDPFSAWQSVQHGDDVLPAQDIATLDGCFKALEIPSKAVRKVIRGTWSGEQSLAIISANTGGSGHSLWVVGKSCNHTSTQLKFSGSADLLSR